MADVTAHHRFKSRTIFLLLMVLDLTACAVSSLPSSSLTPTEYQRIVQLARQKTVDSRVVENEQEMAAVKNTNPQLSLYFSARPYADYSIVWKMPDNRQIVLSGRGNIFELEGFVIRRVP